MTETKTKYNHVWISLALFLVSFTLPGFYSGYKPAYGISLFLIGWLGPIDKNFAWFANLFFFIGLIRAKAQDLEKSMEWGGYALLLALSFLAYKEVMVSEAPTYDTISGVGSGYFLWVTAIAIFTIGQYALHKSFDGKKTKQLFATWLAISISLFMVHFFHGDGNTSEFKVWGKIYSRAVERRAIYNEKCRNVETHIYKKAENVKGIRFEIDKDLNNYDDSMKYYRLIPSLLNDGYILFYDFKNKPPIEAGRRNYTRFKVTDKKQGGEQTDVSESEYIVSIKPFNIPSEFGLIGADVEIKDLKDGSVLATTSYISDKEKGKFCGYGKTEKLFPKNFIIDVLNLTPVYPKLKGNRRIRSILFLEDVVDRLFGSTKYNNTAGWGEVETDFHIMGTKTEINLRRWHYDITQKGEDVELTIRIPNGHYHMSDKNPIFSGEVVHKFGADDSGVTIRKHPKYDGVFVSKEYACGSDGCSYFITIGRDSVMNICQSERYTDKRTLQ